MELCLLDDEEVAILAAESSRLKAEASVDLIELNRFVEEGNIV